MSSERHSIKTRKHVGIWIRVSTEDQAQGDSPQHHEQRARDYAKFNDWEVREVYDLAGVSGKSVMEHPEAKRMLAESNRFGSWPHCLAMLRRVVIKRQPVLVKKSSKNLAATVQS
jgi:hypothetical protein